MSNPALYLSLPSYKRTVRSHQKNGRKPVKRRTQLKLSSKPIRRRSKAMAKRMQVYQQQAEEWLGSRMCANGCMSSATQVHHSRGRRGNLLLDKRFWIPLCAQCHRFVHDHPEEARELGLLCAKGDWNKTP